MKSGTPVNNPIALNIRVEKEIQGLLRDELDMI